MDSADRFPDTEALSRLAGQISRERYAGYAGRPIPDGSDGPVEALLAAYVAIADEPGSVPELSVSQHLARVLVVFGERMATLALRTRDEEPLRRGLLAVGLAAGQDDERDILVVLPLFRHAADWLRVEPAKAYLDVRRHVPQEGREFLDELVRDGRQRPGIKEIGLRSTAGRRGTALCPQLVMLLRVMSQVDCKTSNTIRRRLLRRRRPGLCVT